DGYGLQTDQRPLRGGRVGRRHLLLQLSGRHRAHLGLGVRPDCRQYRRPRGEKLMAKRLNEISGTEAVEDVRSGKFTVEAITRASLDRIQARDHEIKAWAFLDTDLALEQARARDRSKDKGPLAGVTVGVKDIIDTFDMPTDMGSPIYQNNRTFVDASCVA